MMDEQQTSLDYLSNQVRGGGVFATVLLLHTLADAVGGTAVRFVTRSCRRGLSAYCC